MKYLIMYVVLAGIVILIIRGAAALSSLLPPDGVSKDWLHENEVRGAKKGWQDGPVWRGRYEAPHQVDREQEVL